MSIFKIDTVFMGAVQIVALFHPEYSGQLIVIHIQPFQGCKVSIFKNSGRVQYE
ncbi:MAG: hypothetical protein AB8G11_06245 [Saprospiraceae bacterium]